MRVNQGAGGRTTRRGQGATASAAGVVVVGLCAAALVGCSGGSEAGLPAYTGGAGSSSGSVGTTGSSTSSAGAQSSSPQGPPPATPTVSGAFPDAVPTVTEGRSTAPASGTPLKQAVLDYEGALLTGLHTGKAPPNLGAVASGELVGVVVAAVSTWKEKGWSLRGAMVVAVEKVTITGTTGTVSGCLKDSTAAFKNGTPVTPPKTTFSAYSGDLILRGDTWVLTTFTTQSRGRCVV